MAVSFTPYYHIRLGDRMAGMSKARFPFKRNRLRCVRCVNENRKKRKRLRWQAANHGCHARNASDCV